MDKKTIQEWFESTEQPYRDQLLTNLISGVKNIKVRNLKSALDGGFTWKETEEGFNYWSDYNKAITFHVEQ
jgi:hypothetical protein